MVRVTQSFTADVFFLIIIHKIECQLTSIKKGSEEMYQY